MLVAIGAGIAVFNRYWRWYRYWYGNIQSSRSNRKTAGSRKQDQQIPSF